ARSWRLGTRRPPPPARRPVREPCPVGREVPVPYPPPVAAEPALIPVAPEERLEPDVGLAAPDLAVDEGPPLVPADFRDEELAPVGDTFAESEAEPAEPEPALAEPAAPQAWADEPAIFTSASEAAS